MAAQTDVLLGDRSAKVALGLLPGSLKAERYTAVASPLVAVIATETAQAFVDARREKVRALFG